MRTLVFFFLLHFSCAPLNAQNQWTVEKNESSIQTYSRLKQGKTYYETRAVFNVKAPVKRVVELITKVDDWKTWLPHTIDSKITSRVNDSVFFGYTVSSAPWPLSDRDTYFKVTNKKINGKYIITLEGKMNDYPLQSDKVRVKDFHAKWTVTPLKNGEVEIDYTASFDPDGGAPNWVIKNRLIDIRIETALNLMKQLEASNKK
jgi:ribosome-associated toxin RatA of RatAB toxin-antitoxin module